MNNQESSSNWKLEKEIDRICDAFEHSLREGASASIEGFLSEIAADGKDALLFELLLIEWSHFDANAISWSIDRYLSDFPHHTETVEAAALQYHSRSNGLDGEDTEPFLSADEDTDLTAFASIRTGCEVGQYVLEEVLGSGGVGIVYKARQLRTDRRVALKFLNLTKCPLAKRRELRKRFLQEPRAVARLQHDHIVTVFEAGEHDGVPYFSMQLIDGPSLRELTADGPVKCKKAADLTRDIADALQHAHENDVLHRDIKPGNVLIGRDDRPYVTDFGMAKLMVDDIELTQDGRGLGTVAYVSPEQAIDAANVDGRSDVYGIGATLYCLITGRPPFQAATSEDILSQVRLSEPIAPRHLNPKIDRDLETICLKCLSKSPQHRYASAREMKEDVERYIDGVPILARPVGGVTKSWRWLRRRPATASAIALAVCLVLLPAIAGPIWALHEADRRALQGKDIARSIVDKATLSIKVGQWNEAVALCEKTENLPVESKADVVLLASDALAALGEVTRRRDILKSLDSSRIDERQRNRQLLDLADTARLAGEAEEYRKLLAGVDVTQLAADDAAYVRALRAESLRDSVPYLEEALRHNGWHFEAFTELLATLLLLDDVDRLDALTRDSTTRYSEDPSMFFARALTAAAKQDEPRTDELLTICKRELKPDAAERAEALVKLIAATRRVEVPWSDELAELQKEVDSHLSRIRSDLAEAGDGESSSRLIRLLPQILNERFDTSSPNGVVISKSFALLPIPSSFRISKLQKMAAEKPDAMTFCILAEELVRNKKGLEAAEAAVKAIDAPTLYPRIRPYACAFAAALTAHKNFYVKDPKERRELIQRANELVRRRIEMGPLTHYPTSQPLTRIAEAAHDWDLLKKTLDMMPTKYKNDSKVLWSEMVLAHRQKDYLRAIELSAKCTPLLRDKWEVSHAKEIHEESLKIVEQILVEARRSGADEE